MKDTELIQRLSNGDETALQEIGEQFQKGFVNKVKSTYYFDRETLNDVFIDSLLDFYEYVLKGKFEERNTSSIKNLLFTFFSRKLANKAKQENTRKDLEEIVERKATDWQNSSNVEKAYTQKETEKIMNDAIGQLPESCQRILLLYYYEGFSHKEIAEEMDYKNDSISKTRKNQCYQKLEKLIKDAYSKDDIDYRK